MLEQPQQQPSLPPMLQGLSPKDIAPAMDVKYWDSPDVLERAAAFVSAQVKKEAANFRSRANKWLLYDKMYRSVETEDTVARSPFGCKVVDPEPHVITEVMVANIAESLFSNDPPMRYVGAEENDDKQAEIMTSYRADHLRRLNIRERAKISLRQWIVYGTSVVKTPYRVERKSERSRIPATGQVNEKEVITWDDTDWEFVSLFDFLPIGDGNSIQTLDGVCHRVPRTFDQIAALERKKVPVSHEAEVVTGIYCNVDTLRTSGSSKYDLVEYWGRIPFSVVTGKDEDAISSFEGVITVTMNLGEWEREQLENQQMTSTGGIDSDGGESKGPSAVAIRCQENPYWDKQRPFLADPFIRLENEFYGLSLMELLKDKWHELNTTIRQIIDNKTLQLLNPTIEDSNANVQREIKLVFQPRIKADDINGVKPLPIHDFSSNGWHVVAALKNDMKSISGILDIIQGVPIKGDRTSASEFNTTFQQAGIRLKDKIKQFSNSIFKPFLERAWRYDMQFKEQERMVRVVGVKGVEFKSVGPNDIWGNFDLIIQDSLQADNQALQMNKLTNFFAIAAKAPMIFNIPELAKMMWIKMGFPESEAHKIVLAGTPETEMDIKTEVEALAMGQPVLAKQSQDHVRHIFIKQQALQQLMAGGGANDQNVAVFQDNLAQHQAYMQMMMSQMGMMAGQAPQQGPAAPAPAQAQPNPMQQVRGNG